MASQEANVNVLGILPHPRGVRTNRNARSQGNVHSNRATEPQHHGSCRDSCATDRSVAVVPYHNALFGAEIECVNSGWRIGAVEARVGGRGSTATGIICEQHELPHMHHQSTRQAAQSIIEHCTNLLGCDAPADLLASVLRFEGGGRWAVRQCRQACCVLLVQLIDLGTTRREHARGILVVDCAVGLQGQCIARAVPHCVPHGHLIAPAPAWRTQHLHVFE